MNENKYVKNFRKKLEKENESVAVVEPFRDAQEHLLKAKLSSEIREQFFGEAYQDILTQLFATWLLSQPHAVKEREYLYHCAMALGSVKDMMIKYETFGKNAEFVANQKKAQEALDEKGKKE